MLTERFIRGGCFLLMTWMTHSQEKAKSGSSPNGIEALPLFCFHLNINQPQKTGLGRFFCACRISRYLFAIMQWCIAGRWLAHAQSLCTPRNMRCSFELVFTFTHPCGEIILRKGYAFLRAFLENVWIKKRASTKLKNMARSSSTANFYRASARCTDFNWPKRKHRTIRNLTCLCYDRARHIVHFTNCVYPYQTGGKRWVKSVWLWSVSECLSEPHCCS